MKIGIISLTLHTNYGGILQAYALQTVLERMGHEVEVLNRPFTPIKTKWKEIPKRIIKKLLGRDVVIFSERRYNREAPILNKAVWDFRKKYIHERIINSLHEIKEDDYECIVVGSDQVWRPRYFKQQWKTGIEDAYLAFTKGWNIKRIAYAASFGVDTWEYTDDETAKCREAIKMFDAVSVREDTGVDLVNQHLGINAVQMLDPTMLLTREDYTKIFTEVPTPKSAGSLLVYLLEVNKKKKFLVRRIEKERDLKAFSVNRALVRKAAPLEERAIPSVESWLRGLFEARFIITDSFHACVFCLIFDKPFLVIENKNRGVSRIQSLLSALSLKELLIQDDMEAIPYVFTNHHYNICSGCTLAKANSFSFLNNSFS